MSYKQKLKIRACLAFGYILIGVLIGLAVFLSGEYDSFLTPFAVALVVCGVLRVVDHFRIIRDEKALRRREIEETDERNLEIAQRAKSMAIAIYIFVAGTAVVVFQLLDMPEPSLITAYNVCLLTALYWSCHFIVKRKC